MIRLEVEELVKVESDYSFWNKGYSRDEQRTITLSHLFRSQKDPQKQQQEGKCYLGATWYCNLPLLGNFSILGITIKWWPPSIYYNHPEKQHPAQIRVKWPSPSVHTPMQINLTIYRKCIFYVSIKLGGACSRFFIIKVYLHKVSLLVLKFTSLSRCIKNV